MVVKVAWKQHIPSDPLIVPSGSKKEATLQFAEYLENYVCKNCTIIFASLLDIGYNVEWSRFLAHLVYSTIPVPVPRQLAHQVINHITHNTDTPLF